MAVGTTAPVAGTAAATAARVVSIVETTQATETKAQEEVRTRRLITTTATVGMIKITTTEEVQEVTTILGGILVASIEVMEPVMVRVAGYPHHLNSLLLLVLLIPI